ncbi:MAG: TIGR01244 family phosphatase [Alphaproteobacteria bacterium]|nr:TIGR01244 family phosphatase [Alphaproteobacteria bacterium]
MSGKFRRVAENFWVSPQIAPNELKDAAALGVKLVINNRPDNEEPGQPAGAEIEKAARAAGMDYVSIPVSGPPGEAEIERLADALDGVDGPVLAYCRSGMRSAMLRALLLARDGAPPNAVAEEAAAAGYDLSGLRPRLEALSRRAKN